RMDLCLVAGRQIFQGGIRDSRLDATCVGRAAPAQQRARISRRRRRVPAFARRDSVAETALAFAGEAETRSSAANSGGAAGGPVCFERGNDRSWRGIEFYYSAEFHPADRAHGQP